MEEFENQHPKPLSVKDWLVTLLLMAIPVVGIVLLLLKNSGSSCWRFWLRFLKKNREKKIETSFRNRRGFFISISRVFF